MLNMLSAGSIPEYSNAFVVLMGIGTVFLGLILIILLCKIMGAIVGRNVADTSKTVSPVPSTPVQAQTAIENKGELVAAISAAVAENLGRDVEAIRIVSIKKV